VSLICGAVSAAAIIVVWHNPTPAVFAGLVAAAGPLIGIIERRSDPAPLTVQSSEPITISAPAVAVATIQQERDPHP
jgi:hypothetical protein